MKFIIHVQITQIGVVIITQNKTKININSGKLILKLHANAQPQYTILKLHANAQPQYTILKLHANVQPQYTILKLHANVQPQYTISKKKKIIIFHKHT
jgi:hypothetical protein